MVATCFVLPLRDYAATLVVRWSYILGLSLTILGGARPRGLDVGLLRTPMVFYGVICILMLGLGVPCLSRHKAHCIVTVYAGWGSVGTRDLELVLLLCSCRVVLPYRRYVCLFVGTLCL